MSQDAELLELARVNAKLIQYLVWWLSALTVFIVFLSVAFVVGKRITWRRLNEIITELLDVVRILKGYVHLSEGQRADSRETLKNEIGHTVRQAIQDTVPPAPTSVPDGQLPVVVVDGPVVIAPKDGPAGAGGHGRGEVY